MSDDTLTRADRGVAVYEVLTSLYTEAIKGKSGQEATQLKRSFDEAVLHLIEATGARFSIPTVLNSLTTDERAVMLAQSVRRAHQFMTAQLRTTNYDVLLGRPLARLKNIVDHDIYQHLATITTDAGQIFYFGINKTGQHVLSEKLYWQPAENAVA